jgi:hypothetical protein
MSQVIKVDQRYRDFSAQLAELSYRRFQDALQRVSYAKWFGQTFEYHDVCQAAGMVAAGFLLDDLENKFKTKVRLWEILTARIYQAIGAFQGLASVDPEWRREYAEVQKLAASEQFATDSFYLTALGVYPIEREEADVIQPLAKQMAEVVFLDWSERSMWNRFRIYNQFEIMMFVAGLKIALQKFLLQTLRSEGGGDTSLRSVYDNLAYLRY